MALLIQKDVNIYGNIGISELYVRFRLDYSVSGNNIMVHSQVYNSRGSYDSDRNSNKISIEGIPAVLAIPYDRSIDGSDLLTVVHNKFKTFLSTDIYEDAQVLDPSTGLFITESTLTVPKFADTSDISIIDID